MGWREIGRAFGYPECCINFFCGPWINRTCKHHREAYFKIIRARGFQRGYVPCPAHVRLAPIRFVRDEIKLLEVYQRARHSQRLAWFDKAA